MTSTRCRAFLRRATPPVTRSAPPRVAVAWAPTMNGPLAVKEPPDTIMLPQELAAPTVQGSAFDIAKLKNKVVLVYYWASSCKVCIGDFAVMKQLLTTYGAKGFEIVTVNLDEQLSTAQQYLTTTAVPLVTAAILGIVAGALIIRRR